MKLYITLAIFAVIWAIFMFGAMPVIICAAFATLLVVSAKAHDQKYSKKLTMSEIEEMLK